jgi:hypothetical protein
LARQKKIPAEAGTGVYMEQKELDPVLIMRIHKVVASETSFDVIIVVAYNST